MKKISITFLLIAAAITVVSAQKETIVPSGNIVTKEVTVQPFTGIKADGLYELILAVGNKEDVKIEADDNLQKLFSVKNDGNTLVISMPDLKDDNINIKNGKDKKELHLKVYVTYTKLNSLDIAVIGSVHATSSIKADAFTIESKNIGNVDLGLSTNKLTVHNKGVGNITLNGNATNADITNEGVGQFDGNDLVVQTMNIENNGVGHASVNVVKDLTVKDSFLGKVENKGAAKRHVMDGVEM